jgi:hypothetical protein
MLKRASARAAPTIQIVKTQSRVAGAVEGTGRGFGTGREAAASPGAGAGGVHGGTTIDKTGNSSSDKNAIAQTVCRAAAEALRSAASSPHATARISVPFHMHVNNSS